MFRSGRSKSRGKSLDAIPTDLTSLETRLTEKTDLIDDIKKVLPITVQASGIVAIGMQGAGKSTILESLTGVPLSRASGLRRPVKVKIVCDPTCVKEYVLVSGSDPLFKQNTKRLENASDLPAALANLNDQVNMAGSFRAATGHLVEDKDEVSDATIGEEEEVYVERPSRYMPDHRSESITESSAGLIYVRVVRPSGPTYTIIDFPAFTSPPDAAQEAYLRRILEEDEDPKKLILAVLSIKDVFDHADIIHLAKRLDPASKRTIGVVTKSHLVTKDMGIVEKLQMNSNKPLVLPLGYVAVCAADPNNSAANRQEVMQFEHAFFSSNPLLKGLRQERWGLASLKSLVLSYQKNGITQRLPELSQAIRTEIEELSVDLHQEQHRHQHPHQQKHMNKTQGHPVGPVVVFDQFEDVFSRLCSEMTFVMFDVKELADNSSSRQDRKLNLGPRYQLAVEGREAEARRALPSYTSTEVAEWLNKEMGEFRGVIANANYLMHPVFRKAIRELVFPVLRVYARGVIQDMDDMLQYTAQELVGERFRSYTRLLEALMRDVTQVQAAKKEEAERLVGRLLEAELNWNFVDEVDLAFIAQQIEKDVAANERGESAGRMEADDMWDALGVEGGAGGGAGGEGGLGKSKSGKVFLQSSHSRELQVMQCTLHYYVQLLLRRVFYAIPTNTRNVMINEFRHDLMSVVAAKYNDDIKLRALMAEELWAEQSRQQRAMRKAALEEVMGRLDLLS